MTHAAPESRPRPARSGVIGALCGLLLAGCSMHGQGGFDIAAAPSGGAAGYDTVLSPPGGTWPHLREAALPAGEACHGFSTRLSADQDDSARKAAYITRILSESPTGARLVAQAAAGNFTLCFAQIEDDLGYLDYDARRLYLDASLPLPHGIAVTAHELGHLDQKNRGFEATSAMDPRAAIFAIKLMEADAEAVSTRVVYELEGKGYDFSGMVRAADFADYLPVYTAFRRVAATSGNDFAAPMRAAFNSWGDNHALLSDYEDGTLINLFPRHFEGAAQGGLAGCLAPEYGQTPLHQVQKDFARLAARPGQVDYITATGGLAGAGAVFDRIHEPYTLSGIAKIRADIARADICEKAEAVSLSLPRPAARTL